MKNKIKEFEKLIFAREMSILPGNLAFSFFMAVIPMLTLIFYFCTQFHLPMDVINNFLAKTFPKGVVDLLQPVFTSSISMDSIVTLVVGFTVAVNGCNAIIIATNTIYGFDNSSFLRRMIKAVFLAVCVVLLFAFIVIVQVLGNAIIALIGSFTSIIADNKIIVDTLYFILRVPVSLLVVYFFIKTVYAIAPDEKIPSKYMTRGAVFTTITWLLLTFCFSYYINNIARYDLVYGNLANIVMLLLWFYALAYIFVLGLSINRMSYDEGLEQTNTIKLDEIRKKVNKKK